MRSTSDRTVERGIVRRIGKTGVPQFIATVYDENKRQERRSFATLNDARAWRARILEQFARGKRAGLPRPTVRQAGDNYLARMEDGTARRAGGQEYRHQTIQSYRVSLNLHVYPELGAIPVDRLTYRRVQDWAGDLTRAGKSGSLIRNALTALAAVMGDARRQGIIEVSPVQDVRAPARGQRGEEAVTTPEEAARQIGLLPDADKLPWALMFYAGLRLGEVAALRREDINPLKREITVRASKSQHGNIDRAKSDRVRKVPIIGQLEPFLTGPITDPVLCSCRSALARRAKAAGVTTSPHEARHTFATLMLRAGVPLKVVSDVLGHSGIEVTANVYAHVLDADRSAMIDTANRFFDSHQNSHHA